MRCCLFYLRACNYSKILVVDDPFCRKQINYNMMYFRPGPQAQEFFALWNRSQKSFDDSFKHTKLHIACGIFHLRRPPDLRVEWQTTTSNTRLRRHFCHGPVRCDSGRWRLPCLVWRPRSLSSRCPAVQGLSTVWQYMIYGAIFVATPLACNFLLHCLGLGSQATRISDVANDIFLLLCLPCVCLFSSALDEERRRREGIAGDCEQPIQMGVAVKCELPPASVSGIYAAYFLLDYNVDSSSRRTRLVHYFIRPVHKRGLHGVKSLCETFL
ncbi:hypothetical protein B0H13DRAFT_1948820 [Mycena leptocephala]|nr:hypothetical protein B0H13DRAFT_1948820 [Mycena leptocephala]